MIKKYLLSTAVFISTVTGAALLTDVLIVMSCRMQVNPLLYDVAIDDPGYGRIWYAVFGAAAVLAVTMPWRSGWKERLFAAERILRPAWLLFIIPCDRFPGILLAVALIGLVVFQAAGYWMRQFPELPEKYGAAIALAGGFAVAAWGYYLQIRAYDSLHFIWGDWNQYVEHYQNLLSGKASFAQWCAGAGHWNFGVNLFMTAALKLWYAADMVFIVNALCIASIVPLGYWLCRKCNLSTWLSPVLLILTVCNPVLSNQYLSLFYGFHPIVFFVPLLLGFFIAREYENRYFMAVCFVLSLLVQETVCVFWAGYALYLLCCKRWKSGIGLFAAMVGLFFFFSNTVIPAAHDAENYSQMFHYAHLGNNMGEVLLSPLTRPGVFWKTVFERNSICFALAVFVPFLFGIVFKPLMMVTVLPLFAGVILQGSPDVKTVMLQYGLECTLFAMVVMIFNLKRIYPEVRRPALCAVLISTALCGMMLGLLPGCNGEVENILNRPNGAGMISFFDQHAGESARVIATGRIRGQFQFTRPTGAIGKEYRPGDVIILDLHDNGIEDSSKLSEFRRRIAADRRVIPVSYLIWENHTIVMFRVGEKESVPPTVPWLYPVAEKDFVKVGIPLKSTDEYELRYLGIKGKNLYRFLLKKRCENDIEFVIRQHTSSGEKMTAVISFGNGLFPAYTVKPGTAFGFILPGGMLNRIEVSVYNIK